jgi:hypothetical protein
MNIYLDNLRACAETYDVKSISSIVLDNPKFPLWSGSSTPGAHHYGDGGLIKHTWEVISISSGMREAARDETGAEKLPTAREIFLAGLFHDVGKMWDYIKFGNMWGSTEHKRNIHHISRSAIEWCKAVEWCKTADPKHS